MIFEMLIVWVELKGRALKIGNDKELVEYIEDKIVNEKYSPEVTLAEISRGKKLKHLSLQEYYTDI